MRATVTTDTLRTESGTHKRGEVIALDAKEARRLHRLGVVRVEGMEAEEPAAVRRASGYPPDVERRG